VTLSGSDVTASVVVPVGRATPQSVVLGARKYLKWTTAGMSHPRLNRIRSRGRRPENSTPASPSNGARRSGDASTVFT
jgi:hypothetical protein